MARLFLHCSVMGPARLHFRARLCSETLDDELPSGQCQASQKASGHLASSPTLPAAQRSMPSRSAVSLVSHASTSANTSARPPPPPGLCFYSGKDSLSLEASSGECLTDHEDNANASPLLPPSGHKVPRMPLVTELHEVVEHVAQLLNIPWADASPPPTPCPVLSIRRILSHSDDDQTQRFQRFAFEDTVYVFGLTLSPSVSRNA